MSDPPLHSFGEPLALSASLYDEPSLAVTVTTFRIFETGFRFLLAVRPAVEAVEALDGQSLDEALATAASLGNPGVNLTVESTAEGSLELQFLGGRGWQAGLMALSEGEWWISSVPSEGEVTFRLEWPGLAAGQTMIPANLLVPSR